MKATAWISGLGLGISLLLFGCSSEASRTNSTQAPEGVPIPEPIRSEGEETSAAAGHRAERVALGESVTVTDGDEKIVITARQIRYVKQPPKRFDSPPKNGVYVVIDIHCEAIANGYINPAGFYVRDSSGTRYSFMDADISLDDRLDMARLEPGERIRGWIAFDVPEVDDLELVWTIGSRSGAIWTFSGKE